MGRKLSKITEVITARSGREVTLWETKGGIVENPKSVIYSVVTRIEIVKLKSIINALDPEAFMIINDVSDVMGGKHKKRDIH
jgi:uncharacterized membrane-anchored protein YitT (DUF2179 family)